MGLSELEQAKQERAAQIARNMVMKHGRDDALIVMRAWIAHAPNRLELPVLQEAQRLILNQTTEE